MRMALWWALAGATARLRGYVSASGAARRCRADRLPRVPQGHFSIWSVCIAPMWALRARAGPTLSIIVSSVPAAGNYALRQASLFGMSSVSAACVNFACPATGRLNLLGGRGGFSSTVGGAFVCTQAYPACGRGRPSTSALLGTRASRFGGRALAVPAHPAALLPSFVRFGLPVAALEEHPPEGPLVSTVKQEADDDGKRLAIGPADYPPDPAMLKGVHTPVVVTGALRKLCGVPVSTRPALVRFISRYVKTNKLQRATDKRFFAVDAELRAVLGVDECSFLLVCLLHEGSAAFSSAVFGTAFLQLWHGLSGMSSCPLTSLCWRSGSYCSSFECRGLSYLSIWCSHR